MKQGKNEGLKVEKREGMETGRTEAGRPWEMELLSLQEQTERIAELLSRGVLRIIRRDKTN